MLILLSPTKSLNFEKSKSSILRSKPMFLKESRTLINYMQKFSASELSSMMGVSSKIAYLNQERFTRWNLDKVLEATDEPDYAQLNEITEEERLKQIKQAILVFTGEVFHGLDVDTMDEHLIADSQSKLRILSGLYGLLKPNDTIEAYRLEMGQKLPGFEVNNLYKFWGSKITDAINVDLDQFGHKFIVNLASQEYFKSVETKRLNRPVITPVFKERRDDGSYKVIVIYAKLARGEMTRYIIENRCTKPEDLIHFDKGGYSFNFEMSGDISNFANGGEMVFTRG